MENKNITLPIEELEKRFLAALPVASAAIGAEAVNFALDNFKNQGFTGAAFQPWPPRKNPTAWGTAPARASRSLLVDSGTLKGSIRVLRSNAEEVVIGTDVPYAKAHNEGFKGQVVQEVKAFTRRNGQSVKAFTRTINQNIPQRQFIGDSPYLMQRAKRMFISIMMKQLK